MKIEVLSPIFKCEYDKNVFFSRIYSLSGYHSVISEGSNFHLTLKNGFEKDILFDVQEICDVWNTQFKVLD